MNNMVPADKPKPNDKNLREVFFIKKVTNPPTRVESPAKEDNINAIK